MIDCAFYCVSSAAYFPGAVAMINSLRLQGHDEPVVLLDWGLTAPQRNLIEPHVTLVPAPGREQRHPHMLKAVAPLAVPASTTVLVDADLIFTRPLHAVLDGVADDGVVAVTDGHERFVPEWGELLGAGVPRRGRYVSSGFVVLGPDAGPRVLGLLNEHRGLVDLDATFLEHGDDDAYPFRFADQDLLNAIIHTGAGRASLQALPASAMLKQPFTGVTASDPRTLRCRLTDGGEPYMLHHILGWKPWMGGGEESLYVRFMRRLLTGDGLRVQIPPDWLPRNLRRGVLAALERRRLNLRDQARWRAGAMRGRLAGHEGGWR